MRGSRPLRSIRSSAARAAPPNGRSAPFASSSRAPSACAISSAGVVCGAAADADHEAAKSGVQRGADHLAEAVRGGDARVPPVRGHHREPGCPGHLNERRVAVAKRAPSGRDRFAKRPGHGGSLDRSAGAVDQRLQRAVAAVRDRHEHRVGVRHDAQHAVPHRLSHGPRGTGCLCRSRGLGLSSWWNRIIEPERF